MGVLSEYGVAETRDSFWRAFAGGKGFAKRQSMMDLLFTGLRYSSRDESTASVVPRRADVEARGPLLFGSAPFGRRLLAARWGETEVFGLVQE